MLKNIFQTTVRNFLREKSFSVLNILGLTLGLTGMLLLTIFVSHELSFDNFHKNLDSIYQVCVIKKSNTDEWRSEFNPFPLAAELKERAPEIEKISRFYNYYESLLTVEEKKIFRQVHFADADFLTIFSFPLRYGNPASALKEKNSIVLSPELALDLFGKEDAIGETVELENNKLLTVTGITEELPDNSSITFNALVSFTTFDSTLARGPFQKWGHYTTLTTFFLLKEGTSIEKLTQKTAGLLMEFDNSKSRTVEIFYHPFADYHLNTAIELAMLDTLNPDILLYSGLIGLFILLIACINFMNLSTARSMTRAKEVGVRKVLGAGRGQLVMQFLGEAILYALAALVLAFAIAELLLPSFSEIIDRPLQFSFYENFEITIIFIVTGLLTGILSGLYPAFFLARYSPVKVFGKSSTRRSKEGLPSLRKSLVVFQFAISFVLIAGSLIIMKQLDYVMSQPLGFESDYVVKLELFNEDVRNNIEPLKQRILQNPNIKAASVNFRSPIDDSNIGTSGYLEGQDPSEAVSVMMNFVDRDYIDLYGLEVIAGRKFSGEYASDTVRTAIVNEAAVKAFGLQLNDDIIGKSVYLGQGGDSHRIIGVLKDYHTESLRNEITPVMMFYNPNFFLQVSVKIANRDIPSTIAYLEEIWQEIQPEYPFSYTFADEFQNRLYRQEERMSEMIGIFALIAVFTACLGLFGMAAYTVERKKKEIGIRKVLGASERGIVFLLSKEFGKYVLIASLIASPAAYYLFSGWLESFAYRITIGFDIFLLVTILALLIALVTVSFHAIRAARSNPIKSLERE